MKKLLIFLVMILFVIILSGSVTAVATIFDDTDPRFPKPTITYRQDNDCVDERGESDCTTAGSYVTETPFASGSSHSLNITGTQQLDTNYNGIPTMGNFTISMWIKPNIITDYDAFAGTGGAPTFELWYYLSAGYYIQRTSSGVTHKRSGGGPTPIVGEWSHLVLRSNGSTAGSISYFFNGTYVDSGIVQDGAGVFQSMAEDWYIAKDSRGVGETLNSLYDDINIWNETALNDSQIEILSNGSYYAPPPPEDRINISDTLPTNFTQFNTNNIDINVSVNSSYTFNASLYLGLDGVATLNQTITDFAAGQNVFVNFTRTLEDGNWTYYINVTSSDQSEQSINSSFYIDTTQPGISHNFTNKSFFINNITGQFVFSDTNLYSYYIYLNDDLIANQSNIDDVVYFYNLSYFIGNLSASTPHSLIVVGWDGHTSQRIPNYNHFINPLTKDLTYYFGSEWIRISPKNYDLLEGVSTRKITDRYIYTYRRSVLGRTLRRNSSSFVVESSQGISIVKNSPYPGHLVVDNIHKWIDFDLGLDNVTYTTSRINARKVQVTVKGVESMDVLNFRSLGELNNVSIQFEFYNINITETYYSPVLETSQNYFTLNFSINDTIIGGINATLHYNNTAYIPNRTLGGNYYYFVQEITAPFVNDSANISFYWVYNITGINNNFSNTTAEQNQSVGRMWVDNCTTHTTIAINFSIRDELNNSLIVGDLEGLFTVWNSSSSLNREYSFPYKSSATPQICISPSWAFFHVDYEVRYAASRYITRERSVYNGVLSNVTQQINLYLLNTTEGTPITITVVDQYDDGLSDYTVEAHKYSLADNNYTLVAIEKTDYVGVVIMNLAVRNEEEYKFVVRDTRGENVYESSKMKLLDTEYTFRVVEEQEESLSLRLRNFDQSIVNSSGNITLTWNDLTDLVSSTCLGVYRVRVNETEELYYGCDSAEAGTLYYYLGGVDGLYVANAYGHANVDSIRYLLDSLTLDLREEWEIFGKDALIVAFLFVGTMMFIGIAIGPEISLALTAFGMIIFYLLGFIAVALSGVISLVLGCIMLIIKLRRRYG